VRTSEGELTHRRPPAACASSSYTARGIASSGLRTNALRNARRPSGARGGLTCGGTSVATAAMAGLLEKAHSSAAEAALTMAG
jgi:hypothetical protein